MKAVPHSRHLTGWLLDAYPVHDGMALWMLDDEGIRRRLVDPYTPAFYLAGAQADVTLVYKAALAVLGPLGVTAKELERGD